MIKITRTKTYDTETATLVKKVTKGYYGDPAGFEETLYQTPDGDYFLYTNGGADSAYPTEKITGMAKNRVSSWLKKY